MENQSAWKQYAYELGSPTSVPIAKRPQAFFGLRTQEANHFQTIGTGESLRREPLAGIRAGFRIPVNGTHTETVQFPEPNLAGILAELNSELYASLKKDDQKI